MPPKKKTKLTRPQAAAAADEEADPAVVEQLDDNVIAISFGCFPPEDTMRMRCVCKKWREAAKTTIVPMADFGVNSVVKYNAMRVMTTALPNLQQITICRLGNGHKYSKIQMKRWLQHLLILPPMILISYPTLESCTG